MGGFIAAKGVVKQFGDTVALDGVSLSLAEDEVYGLVERSGKDDVRSNARGDAPAHRRRDIALRGGTHIRGKSQICYLPQGFRPPERLTVRERLPYYA